MRASTKPHRSPGQLKQLLKLCPIEDSVTAPQLIQRQRVIGNVAPFSSTTNGTVSPLAYSIFGGIPGGMTTYVLHDRMRE